MRLALIGCMVMNREISYLVAGSKHVVRTWWLRQGLHNTPDLLRTEVQRMIDEVERENKLLEDAMRFEAVILGYGLCSNGVLGLRSRSLPLIVPRCDDCISLFLGSADRYRKLFHEMPGTFWYSPGWIEQSFMPSTENYTRRLAQYTELYGEENAEYLLECDNAWMKNYHYCGYITCPLARFPQHEAYSRQAAEDFGWEYREIEGQMGYFESLVNGPWDNDRFLTCPPQSVIEADFSEKKFRSVPAGAPDL